MSDTDTERTGGALIIHPLAVKMTEPPKFRDVILWNDDYTPIEYVRDVLMRDFQQSLVAAASLSAKIHCDGWAIGGSFPAEVAEQKALKVTTEAQTAGHPFRAEVRPL